MPDINRGCIKIFFTAELRREGAKLRKAGILLLNTLRFFAVFLSGSLWLNFSLLVHPIKISCILLIIIGSSSAFGVSPSKYPEAKSDTLPNVLSENHSDLVSCRLKFDAARLSAMHSLPGSKKEWVTFRTNLIGQIGEKTRFVTNHELPLNLKETGSIQLKGYSIRNVFFQTRPGICATANLYIPDGSGKFPGVIVMMGHAQTGRLDDRYQSLGHTLALNGYVALCIDPWGSGERTTVHGIFEDHGDENNLGSSLLNIGEPLMGIEISDNIRGVDLLCSLQYVDSQNIGATGSSGGGNQTMWLTAVDERIKAAVPVVSAGTFESYIMGTPCICEVLRGGLNLTEEAGILALIAPRAIKMCNHQKDNNQAFRPPEMIRSYKNAKPIFELYGAADNISYEVFDLPHGYFPQDREVMLGWFDLHLKKAGNGSPKKELPFELLPKENLMVFKNGERDQEVTGTASYCELKGIELRTKYLKSKSSDLENKRDLLREILGVKSKASLKSIRDFPDIQGWSRFALETSENMAIPVLVRNPAGNSGEFVIICNPEGKGMIPQLLIDKLITSGKGIAIVDLSGTGELISQPNTADKKGTLMTMSRSLLWFGKTVIGEWVNELIVVNEFLTLKCHARKIEIDASMEAGVTALFYRALGGKAENLILRSAPVSYLFDNRENIDFFSMGINLPGILNWCDISLAAALSGVNITFIGPVTMSGRKLSGSELDQYTHEFNKIKRITNTPGKTIFIQND